MATLRQSTQVANNTPPISADGYEPIALVGDYVVEAGLVINDVVEMVTLPAGYVPYHANLAVEDTDSNGSPTITLDMGLISGAAGAKDNTRTCSNEAFAASTVAQAGGVAAPSKKDFFLIAPTTADRGFGVKVAAAAATLTVGAKWRLNVLARPALDGV